MSRQRGTGELVFGVAIVAAKGMDTTDNLRAAFTRLDCSSEPLLVIVAQERGATRIVSLAHR